VRHYSQNSATFYSDLFPFAGSQNFEARDQNLAASTNNTFDGKVTWAFAPEGFLIFKRATASFDVITRVAGGGVNAQADAVKMGIARALLEFNAELRKTLKSDGLLTRDARAKERKKYGQKGARKRFQFSKR